MLLDTCLIEEGILSSSLVDHYLLHHQHLTLLRGCSVLIHTTRHHAFHCLHLYSLLDPEYFEGLILGKHLEVILIYSGSLLLNLHDLHALILIAAMVLRILVELLLADAKLSNDVHKLIIN